MSNIQYDDQLILCYTERIRNQKPACIIETIIVEITSKYEEVIDCEVMFITAPSKLEKPIRKYQDVNNKTGIFEYKRHPK